METVQGPLNKAQLELLKIFSKIKTEEELLELKSVIGLYYAKKATEEADRLWDERGYTQATMDKWLEENS